MKQSILTLAQKLISIPSIQKNASALNEVLNIALDEVSKYNIKSFKQNDSKSALIYNTSQYDSTKYKIILNAHLDVVEAPQYAPIVRNNKLFGRGAYDMKAAAAVNILLFNELAHKLNYPIALQLVTDEEVGGFNGTKYQVSRGINADFVMVGESNSNLDIKYASKGVIRFKVTTLGKSAHGAYPWKGDNALIKMNNIINKLMIRFPIPNKEVWKSTLTCSKINTSNTTINKVPDHCEMWSDLRFVPEDKKIIDTLNNIIKPDGELEIILDEPAFISEPNSHYIKLLRQTIFNSNNLQPQLLKAHGSSDLRHYANTDAAGVEFGPIGANAHGDDEYVNIKSLFNYYNILKSFLLSNNGK